MNELSKQLKETNDVNEIIAIVCDLITLAKTEGQKTFPKELKPNSNELFGYMRTLEDFKYIESIEQFNKIIIDFHRLFVEKGETSHLAKFIGNWTKNPPVELRKIKNRGLIIKMQEPSLEWLDVDPDEEAKKIQSIKNSGYCTITGWINHVKKNAIDLELELFGKHNRNTMPLLARFILETIMRIKNKDIDDEAHNMAINLKETINHMYDDKTYHYNKYRSDFLKQLERITKVASLPIEGHGTLVLMWPRFIPDEHCNLFVVGFQIPRLITNRSVSIDINVLRQLYVKSDIKTMAYLAACEVLDRFSHDGNPHRKYLLKDNKFQLNPTAAKFVPTVSIFDIATKMGVDLENSSNPRRSLINVHENLMYLDKMDYVRVDEVEDENGNVEKMYKKKKYKIYGARRNGEREWEQSLKQLR